MTPYFALPENRDKYTRILDSWLGTPYRHMLAIKGRGADCVLFVAATLVELGLIDDFLPTIEHYPRQWHIHGSKEILLEGIKKYRNRLKIGELRQSSQNDFIWGDWLCFAISPTGLVNHSAVYIGDGKLIHSLQGMAVRKSQLRTFEKWYKCYFRLYI